MEKPPLKAANKGKKPVKFLPKATSFSFANPAFSPGREKNQKIMRRGFSGTLLPVLPPEQGKKPASQALEPPEPYSPKVSCIGQIKHKKKICRSKRKSPPPRKSLGLARIFSMRLGSRKPVEEPPKAAPSLSQARRFASGRDALANFDWRAQRVASDESPELLRSQSAALEPNKESKLWKKRNGTSLAPLKL